LFYRSIPDGRIMVAGYSSTGDSFSAAQPVRWSETPVILNGFDSMLNGKGEVLIPEAGQKATHATFLLNFIDNSRGRLNARK